MVGGGILLFLWEEEEVRYTLMYVYVYMHVSRWSGKIAGKCHAIFPLRHAVSYRV